jgi:hypothetical protein
MNFIFLLFKLAAAAFAVLLLSFLYLILTPVTADNVSFRTTAFCYTGITAISFTRGPTRPADEMQDLDCACFSQTFIASLGHEGSAKLINGFQTGVTKQISKRFSGSTEMATPEEFGWTITEADSFARAVVLAGKKCTKK